METINHLKAARLKAGFTQAQLAITVGCSQADISKYERGTIPRRLDVAERLAASLGIPRDQVIFGPTGVGRAA